MVLIIISFLSLIYMLYSFLSSSNLLLHSKNKLSMSLPLNFYNNHNIYGVYQFLPKNKLNWRELCTLSILTTQSKLNLQ